MEGAAGVARSTPPDSVRIALRGRPAPCSVSLAPALLAPQNQSRHGSALTKTFAPLLLEAKGRVVMISSISGTLSGALMGAYSMSKHAVEAYGDALAAELAPLGVRVSLVEQGNFRSAIGRTTSAQIQRATDANPTSPYAP